METICRMRAEPLVSYRTSNSGSAGTFTRSGGSGVGLDAVLAGIGCRHRNVDHLARQRIDGAFDHHLQRLPHPLEICRIAGVQFKA